MSITTEVPAFTLQGAVLRRVSPEALLNLALAATALRLALYGLLPLAGTPWAVLPVELLHGVTFGLGWGAATASSMRLAPSHLAATMQVQAAGAGQHCRQLLANRGEASMVQCPPCRLCVFADERMGAHCMAVALELTNTVCYCSTTAVTA